MTQARRPRDVIAAVLDCLTEHGLRGSWGELQGDEVVVLDLAVPEEDAARVEELLGVPIGAMRFPLAVYPALGDAVRCRTSTIEDSFPSRIISRFPHLTNAEKAVARHHLGAGPLLAAPIADGDALLGVLFAWGPSVVSQRTLVETLAALAGFAWSRVNKSTDVVQERIDAASPASSDVGKNVLELLAPSAIRAALQPLVRLRDRCVLGYEALCRFSPRPGLSNPDELFVAATVVDMKREVDTACLVAAFAAAAQTVPATLFVNVTVETLVEGRSSGDRLSRLADSASVSPSDVVLEVSERTPISDLNRLRRVVADLRQRGFRIAIDDAGAGYASMLVIAEVQPEFVKIDRLLIHGVDVSAARRALVVSLLSFGAHINARVIAEGIETDAELQTLLSLGVQFGQGWHLGRPVMVAPPADAGGVIAVGPEWFSKQHAAPFQTTAAMMPSPPSVGHVTAIRSRRPGPAALPQALINAAAALQSEHDPATIFAVIAEQLQTVVPVDAVYIYAADEKQNRFVPVHATGREAAARMAYGYPMGLGVNGWAFKLGVPQNISDVSSHPATITIPGTPVGAPESYLIIPLIAGDRRLGVLDCSRLGIDRFTSKDLEAAALFGHTAAAAWRNAELYRELSERSITDPLTGLLNSRWLREVGERELAQSRRSGQSLAILLLDLDKFKQINDSGGHGAGDLVLRRVGAALRGIIRSGDAAVRLGGEEFLLVLRDTDEVGGKRIAVEFRERLAALSLPRSCLPRSTLAASTGIAVLPNNGIGMAELVRAADVAMYEAKRAGGDRYQVSKHRPDKRRVVRPGKVR
ncbi:MAG TPA: EAL domain-containing protein, partial [Candidatus Dormibacteraeota bacterium]